MIDVPVIVRARDRDLLADLAVYAEYGDPYQEPMPRDEWAGTKTDLGVVVGPSAQGRAEQAIAFLCLATKGKRTGERYALATFSELVPVAPVPVSQWLTEMPNRYRGPLSDAVAMTGKPIPRTTWVEARAALLRLRPDLAGPLGSLERRLEPSVPLPDARQRVFAEEKDATSLAVSIALGRTPLTQWEVPDDDRAPWLSGLNPGRIREDVEITHDASRVEGWWPSGEPHVGVREFVNSVGERLTVMNVNRQPVEQILGVDLLYYRHEPASFVLVQYKRTAPRKLDDPADANAVFYPSGDPGLADELRRMRTIDQDAADEAVDLAVSEYRLHSRACWVKLTESHSFVPNGPDLIPGMYLPVDFYDTLLADPVTLGPRDGRRLDRERLPRWINNTLFVDLMSGGWIGSRGAHTERLTTIIRDALERQEVARDRAGGTQGPTKPPQTLTRWRSLRTADGIGTDSEIRVRARGGQPVWLVSEMSDTLRSRRAPALSVHRATDV